MSADLERRLAALEVEQPETSMTIEELTSPGHVCRSLAALFDQYPDPSNYPREVQAVVQRLADFIDGIEAKYGVMT
jgi:hypothetical protein